MFGRNHKKVSNYRFRFRSEPGDPRKDDIVHSIPLSMKELRRKKIALAIMIGKCVAITGAVIALITFANSVWRESITANPNFTVGEFNFSTNVSSERGGLTRDSILEVTKLRADMNVMKVDLKALQAALVALPQVQEAAVQRFFPNRIDIRIVERQPVAWLACGPKNIIPRDTTHGRLLDSNGVVFECRSLLNQFNHLPTINIPGLTWVETGRPLADGRALKAIQLIKDFGAQVWAVPLRIHEIKVENEYSFETTLTDQSIITFGSDDTKRQTERLALIYQHAKETNKIVATAKMIATENTPVTFVRRQHSPAPAPALSGTDATPRAKSVATKSNPNAQLDADIRAIKRGN